MAQTDATSFAFIHSIQSYSPYNKAKIVFCDQEKQIINTKEISMPLKYNHQKLREKETLDLLKTIIREDRQVRIIGNTLEVKTGAHHILSDKKAEHSSWHTQHIRMPENLSIHRKIRRYYRGANKKRTGTIIFTITLCILMAVLDYQFKMDGGDGLFLRIQHQLPELIAPAIKLWKRIDEIMISTYMWKITGAIMAIIILSSYHNNIRGSTNKKRDVFEMLFTMLKVFAVIFAINYVLYFIFIDFPFIAPL